MALGATYEWYDAYQTRPKHEEFQWPLGLLAAILDSSVERYCLPAGFKVLWGIEAKKELLEKDLTGLYIMALREILLGDTLKHFRGL